MGNATKASKLASKTHKRFIFNDPRLRKQMIHLFIPFFLQELVIILTTLMSNFVLKWWGCYDTVTTGIANAIQIYFLFSNAMAGVCYISNLFMSQHYGRGDIEGVERTYYVVLKIALVIGILFFVLCETIPEYLLFFDNVADSKAYGAQYLRWFAPVFLLTALTLTNYTLLKNTHLEKYCTISSLITLTFILTFETALVCGVNIENLALEFAAISMLIGRLVECAFCFIVINKKCVIKFKFNRLFKSDAQYFRNIIYYGIPMFIAKTSWGFGYVFITVFTNMHLPTDIITAHSLMITYQNIICCLSNALASVIAVIIGRELGANRLRKAEDHGSDISRLLLLMGFIEIAAFMLFLPIAMVTTGGDTLAKASDFLWKVFLIQTMCWIPRSYNSSYINGLFNAGGDTKFIFLVDGLTAWLTIVPLGYIGLHCNWDPLLIYALLQLEELIKFPIIVWRYKTKKWVFNITQKKGIVFNE